MRVSTDAAVVFAGLLLLLPGCGGSGYGRVSLAAAPKIVNVSAYDPKEKQRDGDSYSASDVSALRGNGAHGLIARAGKGCACDDKCAEFLASANREGLLLGTYYRITKGTSPVRQADQYIDRLRQISSTGGLQDRKILLVGDMDTNSSVSDIISFIDRIEQRTGVVPVLYLENSDKLRATLRNAPSSAKRRIGECPYWLALYSHDNGFQTPRDLMHAYGIWDDWALWQYAGVEWHRRSVPMHYHHGPWRSPAYFGNMDRPLEHNAFNGTAEDLRTFWDKHSWHVR